MHTHNVHIIVMGKVPQLGGKNSQFQHIRTSNTEGGMKILQNEITGTQTSFSRKLSFLPLIPFSWAPPLLLHIFSLLLPIQLL
jgi:hypothetical protein